MKNYFDVQGKVAFVTGASKGLGKVFADTLGDAGAKLFILASNLKNTLLTRIPPDTQSEILKIIAGDKA